MYYVSFAFTESYFFTNAKTISTNYDWNLPKGFPLPLVPNDNPMTKEKVDLGRYLFYDTLLSSNKSISCASCHDQKKAFTDGKTIPSGVTGEFHTRNSMSLTNVAYNTTLTWNNPLIIKLENQAFVPIFGENPIEMGMVGEEELLVKRLESESRYREKFKKAFPQDKNPINLKNMSYALSSFQRTIISSNSPYDKFIYEKNDKALSNSAKRGKDLFFSEKLSCFKCHGGFNFSNSTKHSNTKNIEKPFHNNGLYNIDQKGSYPNDNTGIYELSNKIEDMGKFKAPTLRNISLTAPYMHDGSISTLSAVIDHYASGGRTIISGKYSGVGSKNPLKSPLIKGFKLTSIEKKDLLEFLNNLTDKVFINDPKLSSPYK